ncbi:MAG: hypothetical protein RLN78_00625 [Phycisphaerales bacterium]
MSLQRWMLVVVLCLCGTAVFAQDKDSGEPVDIRTVHGVISGSVVGVTSDGVEVQRQQNAGVGNTQVIPWFELYLDFGEKSDGVGRWSVPAEFQEIHRHSRVGYLRRLRGDLKGCASSYRAIVDRLLDSQSSMSREVCSGLLEDAILRGDLYDATVMMGALLQDGEGQRLQGAPEYDARYGVFVQVPMIQSAERVHALRAVGQRLIDIENRWGAVIKGQEILDGLRDNNQMDDVIQEISEHLSSSRESRLGVELHQNMLVAQRHPNADMRSDARGWLESRAESKSGTWLDAWCRLGLGSSFLYEAQLAEDEEMRSRGVIQLTHVAIRFRMSYPLLSKRANMMAVESLRQAGRFEEASEYAHRAEVWALGAENEEDNE